MATALDDLVRIHEKITNYMLDTNPTSEKERDQFARLRASRDQLTLWIRGRQLADLTRESKELAAVLATHGQHLVQIGERMEATANHIEHIENMVSYAEQAVAAAAQIVGVVVALA